MADRFRIRFTRPALADLTEIAGYHAEMRGLDDAEVLVDGLSEHVARLDRFPLRGPVPKELHGTGRTDVRQTVLGPHRIFYIVRDQEVAVFMVADDRRDIAALLDARLLAPDPAP